MSRDPATGSLRLFDRRTTVNVKGGLERVRSGELLYTDEVGHDACGIGGVAARDGKPSAEVLRKAVTALKCMEHRGGVCGDAGDGAGITTAIPQAFLKEEAKRLKFDRAAHLKPEDTLAVGVCLPRTSRDPAKIDQARALHSRDAARRPGRSCSASARSRRTTTRCPPARD